MKVRVLTRQWTILNGISNFFFHFIHQGITESCHGFWLFIQTIFTMEMVIK
jgi:hypothetical protein